MSVHTLRNYPKRIPLRAIIEATIKSTLLEIGRKELEEVESTLEADYKCNFFDCMEHPDYLAKILKKLYPDNYNKITKSLVKNLRGFIPRSLFVEFERQLRE